MQRSCSTKGYSWSEKTISQSRQREAEKCIKRLEQVPKHTLFEENADWYAQEIWDNSYDSEENVYGNNLKTAEEIKNIIFSRFSDEIMGISPLERVLMKDAAVEKNGVRQIEFSDELFAAESIVKRMWGTVRLNEKTQHFDLIVPQEICKRMFDCIVADEYSNMNEITQNASRVATSMLYICGACEMEKLIDKLEEVNFTISIKKIVDYPQLLRRFFLSLCDYVKLPDGRIMLFHEAATDTDLMIENYIKNGIDSFDVDYEMIMAAQGDAFDTEIPMLQRMLVSISQAVRPEFELEDVVNDLRYIVKQGANYDEAVEVLKTMLATTPTEGMLVALQDICSNTPRWINLSCEVRQ